MMALLLVSLVTAGIVHTVHTSLIFAPFRVLVNAHFGSHRSRWRRWIYQGFQCGYCFSHWVAAGVSAVVAASIAEWFLLWIAGMWLANHSMGLFNLLANVNEKVKHDALTAMHQSQLTQRAFPTAPTVRRRTDRTGTDS